MTLAGALLIESQLTDARYPPMPQLLWFESKTATPRTLSIGSRTESPPMNFQSNPITANAHPAPRAVRWLRGALAISLLGPAVLYGFLFVSSRQSELDATTARLGRVAQIAQEQAARVVETNDVVYRAVAERVQQAQPEDLKTQALSLHVLLSRLCTGLRQFQSVWIWDDGGWPIASSRMAKLPQGLSVQDRSYFQAAMRAAPDSGWFISEPLKSRATGEPFIDFSRRRSAKDGSFLGVISVSLYPGYFTGFFADQVAQDPAFSVGLYRSDGTVLSRFPEVAFGARLAANSPLLAAMSQGHAVGSHSGVSSLDGRMKIVSYRRVGDLPLYAAAVADIDATLSGWRASMLRLAAVMLTLSLSLAGLCVLAIKMVGRDEGSERALRQEAEQRLKAEEALRHAQKMEALGRLTGSVAHDFNNVLMVVQTSSSLLSHLLAKGKPVDRPLAAIQRAINTGSQLTRQLLAFARRQPLKMQVCSLGDSLEEMRPLLASALGSSVSLTLAIEPGLPAVNADPAELELAVINLVNNARDAMPEGGKIDVDVRRVEKSADATDDKAIEWVALRVSDTGIGIPESLHGKVLEPFFTTKAAGKGTGLGLSQVMSFAEHCGGRLTLESAEGNGTTVSIYLPGSAAEEVSSTEALKSPPISVQGRVLLVEDNLEIVDALLPLLQALGGDVHHVATADQAVQLLEDPSQKFDVVLSDIQMPGELSGLDMAIWMRDKRPELPVVLMTGYTDQIRIAMAQGFTVLAKPVSPERLTATLQDALTPR